MAIIGVSDLQIILDKAARWAAEVAGDSAVVTSPNGGVLIANGHVLAALETAVAALTDVEQLGDLLPAARDLADGLPQINSWAGSNWAGVLDALDRHCRRYGYADLDAYLTYLNATTATLRAHGDFAKYLGRISAPNVFTPANVILMHITVTGADTATFTHVAGLDTTKYGKGEIKLLNTKAEGLTTTTLTFPKAQKIVGGVAVDHSVAVTNTTQTDAHLTVFDDTDLAFIDVLVASATIAGGYSTDTFDVVLVPDRSITSA